MPRVYLEATGLFGQRAQGNYQGFHSDEIRVRSPWAIRLLRDSDALDGRLDPPRCEQVHVLKGLPKGSEHLVAFRSH